MKLCTVHTRAQKPHSKEQRDKIRYAKYETRGHFHNEISVQKIQMTKSVDLYSKEYGNNVMKISCGT
jgi:hypothetical protein